MSFQQAVQSRSAAGTSGVAATPMIDQLGGDPLGGHALGGDPLGGDALGGDAMITQADAGASADVLQGAEAGGDLSEDVADASIADALPAPAVKAGAPGDGEPSGDDAGDGEAEGGDGEALAGSKGEGLGSKASGSLPGMNGERYRGLEMPLPESPIPPEYVDGVPKTVERPPRPKGLETFDLFGMTLPDPFYSKTQLTRGVLDETGQKWLSGIVYGGDFLQAAGNFLFGAAVKGGLLAATVGPALLLGGGLKHSLSLVSTVGTMAQVLGPLTMLSGAIGAGVGIYDAINEGPGLFNTLTNSDLSGFTRAAAVARGVGIASGILSGLAGYVSGALATTALILVLTVAGAAFAPFLGKLSLAFAVGGVGLTGLAIVMALVSAVLQKIGALDEATRMAGVLKAAETADENADKLVATSREALGHESGVIGDMSAALNERGAKPDAENPFDLMRAHAETHELADVGAQIAAGLGENLSEENSPFRKAVQAHEGSAVHIDMVLGVAREKQAMLHEQNHTLTEVSQTATHTGQGLKSFSASLAHFEPLLAVLSDPLIQMTAMGEGPLAHMNLFGLKFRNELAIESARAGLTVLDGVRTYAHVPGELVDDGLSPLKTLPGLLGDRDHELGVAILKLTSAKASHDEAGEILAERQESMLEAFGLAEEKHSERLSHRAAITPRIEPAKDSLKRAILEKATAGATPAVDATPPA